MGDASSRQGRARAHAVTATAGALAAALIAAAPAAASTQAPDPAPGKTRQVILVGNNWDGTTDVVDPHTFERLDRIDVVPDRAEREMGIFTSPDRLAFFLGIRQAVGEGHDQLNDDVFSSHDGRRIFVSRPSYSDVVGIDLATKQIVWRTPVDGYRSDHMAISPDGSKLLVSASTGNVVHEIDTETGEITGEFPSGDSPHENNYSEDGKRIYHASIGRVYTPTDREVPILRDTSKGARHFQVVDAGTLEIVKRFDMGEKLEEAGYPGMSSAVRPMALSADERTLYAQVSFLHGYVEYDLVDDRVVRVVKLPLSEEAASTPPELYLLDSAHHGLALSSDQRKLCVAGTMSDYAAIVDVETGSPQILDSGKKPYWSTNSANGRQCYVSASGDDRVTVIDYETEKVLTRFDVGFHPQRVRNAVADLRLYPAKEPLEVATFHERSPITVVGRGENIGCRLRKGSELRLVRCDVRILARARGRKRPAVIARGSREVLGQGSIKVSAELTRAGRALLRRRPRGFRATLVVRVTDNAARTRAVRKRVTFRRGN